MDTDLNSYESDYVEDEDLPGENGLSSSDFNCGVCYEMMVLPTTLKCGHNFCRPCLAQWYLSSKKTECPVCRQFYQEKPAVNSLVKNLLEKSFGDRIKERTALCLTTETKKFIEQYDNALTPGANSRNMQFNWNINRNRNGADFCSGFLFMLGIVIILYLVWYWRNIDDGLLIKKNVIHWTPENVHLWLSDLGRWTEPYRETFLNNSIDGRLLIQLREDSLKSLLNFSKPLHLAAILSSIESLRDTGVKHVSTIWEYKALHPGYALFLLYGIKDYPRLTMMYLYWFEYDNMFVPFVHFTCPEEKEDYITNLQMYDTLSKSQEIEFYTKVVFLPYLLVGQFAWEFLSLHYWTSRFVLVNCLALTILEAAGVRWFMSGGWRDLRATLKTNGSGVLGMLFCIMIWPIIPNFICDFFFYVALYFSPYTNCEKLYKVWNGRGG